MTRHRNTDWSLPDKVQNWEQVAVAVLMDIRNAVQEINSRLSCYRVPRALDDLHSLGIAARRRRKRRAPK